MASMKDVARKAGTSVATVSRVLNDPNYKCATDGLRERIYDAVIELKYSPNEAAVSLNRFRGRSSASGVGFRVNILVTKTDADSFFNEMLKSIFSELHKNGCVANKVWYMTPFSVYLAADRNEVEACIKKILEEPKENREGLIIIGNISKDTLKRLKSLFKGVVLIRRYSAYSGEKDVDGVACNQDRIMKEVITYLMSLGHSKIAYVGDCKVNPLYKAYLREMGNYGLEISTDFIYEKNRRVEDGMQAAQEIESLYDRPTAVFCGCDVIAIGMIKYIYKNKKGYYIPSIISCDGIEEGEMVKPMLTTIALPCHEMGYEAVRVLIERLMGHHQTKSIEFDGKMIKRDSCFPVSACFQDDYII